MSHLIGVTPHCSATHVAPFPQRPRAPMISAEAFKPFFSSTSFKADRTVSHMASLLFQDLRSAMAGLPSFCIAHCHRPSAIPAMPAGLPNAATRRPFSLRNSRSYRDPPPFLKRPRSSFHPACSLKQCAKRMWRWMRSLPSSGSSLRPRMMVGYGADGHEFISAILHPTFAYSSVAMQRVGDFSTVTRNPASISSLAVSGVSAVRSSPGLTS
mmetsp:Transcript_21573/g.52812  ORF Transcript_21573/g.52812 Transcript_21573/m.52812 type:complete len:212 (+) Transcript_21573:715-1350(+)